MRAEIVKSYRLELWSKYMEGSVTPVLTISDERMRKLGIGGGVTNNIEKGTPYPEIIALEKKCDGELREVAAIVEGIDILSGGRWFIFQSECEDFASNQIPSCQFKWFVDILIYPQFVTGETVLSEESQRDKVRAAKLIKTK